MDPTGLYFRNLMQIRHTALNTVIRNMALGVRCNNFSVALK